MLINKLAKVMRRVMLSSQTVGDLKISEDLRDVVAGLLVWVYEDNPHRQLSPQPLYILDHRNLCDISLLTRIFDKRELYEGDFER